MAEKQSKEVTTTIQVGISAEMDAAISKYQIDHKIAVGGRKPTKRVILEQILQMGFADWRENVASKPITESII